MLIIPPIPAEPYSKGWTRADKSVTLSKFANMAKERLTDKGYELFETKKNVYGVARAGTEATEVEREYLGVTTGADHMEHVWEGEDHYYRGRKHEALIGKNYLSGKGVTHAENDQEAVKFIKGSIWTDKEGQRGDAR